MRRLKHMTNVIGVLCIVFVACLTAHTNAYAESLRDYEYIAEKAIREGDYAGAVTAANKMMAIDPQYRGCYELRGKAYDRLNENEKALADYSTAIGKGSTDYDILTGRATIYDIKGETEKAIADYSTVIEYYPQEPRIGSQYTSRAKLYEQQGKYDLAIADYTKLATTNAETGLDNRARVYEKIGEYEKAITDYSAAIQADANDPNFAPDLASYKGRASVYVKTKEYDKALADYSKYIDKNPNGKWNSGTYIDRAGVYVKKGDYDRALQDCSKAIEIDPKESTWYGFRGTVYAQKGEYDKALSDCNKAIEMKPGNNLGYRFRGEVYLRMGDFDRALTDLNKAIGLFQKDTGSYRVRGEIYAQKGENDKALGDFTQALELNPQNDLAYLGRGKVYAQQGDYAKALQDFESCLKNGGTVDPKEVAAVRAKLPNSTTTTANKPQQNTQNTTQTSTTNSTGPGTVVKNQPSGTTPNVNQQPNDGQQPQVIPVVPDTSGQKKEIEGKIKDAVAQQTVLQKKISDLTAFISQSESAHSDLTNKYSEANAKYKREMISYDLLSTAYARYTVDKQTAETAAADAQKTIHECNNNIQTLKANLTPTKETAEKLVQTSAALDANKKTLATLTANLKQALQLSVDIPATSGGYDYVQRVITGYEQNLSQLSSGRSQKDNNLPTLNARKTQLDADLKAAQAAYDVAQKTYNTALTAQNDAQNILSNLQYKQQEATIRVKEANNAIAILNKEYTEKSSQLVTFRQDLKKVEAELKNITAPRITGEEYVKLEKQRDEALGKRVDPLKEIINFAFTPGITGDLQQIAQGNWARLEMNLDSNPPGSANPTKVTINNNQDKTASLFGQLAQYTTTVNIVPRVTVYRTDGSSFALILNTRSKDKLLEIDGKMAQYTAQANDAGRQIAAMNNQYGSRQKFMDAWAVATTASYNLVGQKKQLEANIQACEYRLDANNGFGIAKEMAQAEAKKKQWQGVIDTFTQALQNKNNAGSNINNSLAADMVAKKAMCDKLQNDLNTVIATIQSYTGTSSADVAAIANLQKQINAARALLPAFLSGVTDNATLTAQLADQNTAQRQATILGNSLKSWEETKGKAETTKQEADAKIKDIMEKMDTKDAQMKEQEKNLQREGATVNEIAKLLASYNDAVNQKGGLENQLVQISQTVTNLTKDLSKLGGDVSRAAAFVQQAAPVPVPPTVEIIGDKGRNPDSAVVPSGSSPVAPTIEIIGDKGRNPAVPNASVAPVGPEPTIQEPHNVGPGGIQPQPPVLQPGSEPTIQEPHNVGPGGIQPQLPVAPIEPAPTPPEMKNIGGDPGARAPLSPVSDAEQTKLAGLAASYAAKTSTTNAAEYDVRGNMLTQNETTAVQIIAKQPDVAETQTAPAMKDIGGDQGARAPASSTDQSQTSKLAALIQQNSEDKGEEIVVEKYTEKDNVDQAYVGQPKKSYKITENENGEKMRVEISDMQYTAGADGKPERDSYREEHKMGRDGSGALVKTVAKANIRYDVNKKENNWAEVVTQNNNIPKNPVTQTLKIVKNGKVVDSATCNVDDKGKENFSGNQDLQKCLGGIRVAAKTGGGGIAKSLSAAAHAKMNNGLSMLDTVVRKVEQSAAESAAKLDKIVNQANFVGNQKAGQQTDLQGVKTEGKKAGEEKVKGPQGQP